MIHAIQQLGLGVFNKQRALAWFARILGFRTVIFSDQGEAAFMTRYTGGELCHRHAALLLNSRGGSGLEIWQHSSRKPLPQPENMSLRSTGLLIGKLRCKGLDLLVDRLRQDSEPSLRIIGGINKRPTGERCCYFTVFGTWFQLIEGGHFFAESNDASFCAGISGVAIGVSDMESSLSFYRKLLGYGHVLQDKKDDEWDDWKGFCDLHKNNNGCFRRVVLQREHSESGLYAKFFGVGEIELIEAVQNPIEELRENIREGLNLENASHVYAGRCWGDPGLIHLCFDVGKMKHLAIYCAQQGHPFTVDSGAAPFAMGSSASGHFAYLEDPDGSLIEFVETYRIPLFRKLGLSLRVQNKSRALPSWLLRIATRDNYSV